MATARQKILRYILEERGVTVEALSRVFKVTQANIRHHLSILVEQGSVRVIGKMEQNGKGRPSQIFTASQRSDQNNLEQLTDTLLSTLLSDAQPENSNVLMHEIARQMVSKTIVDKHNPTRQLYSTIRALNRMSYQAHWEAHIENPRIMLGHCPYQAILAHHPEICQLDAFLLQELLDTPVSQAGKLSPNTKSLPECVFLINKRPI
jgi:predicted ArsR family transcriptional regulator